MRNIPLSLPSKYLTTPNATDIVSVVYSQMAVGKVLDGRGEREHEAQGGGDDNSAILVSHV